MIGVGAVQTGYESTKKMQPTLKKTKNTFLFCFLNNKEITKTIKEIGNKIIPAPIFKFYLLLLKAY
ncbi:MAG: hypothetical protein BAA03_00295 [Caldibacillus debilis]|nr:MAG: hypothetical protein BAA03_00295 [Caldibacillus debilis]